MQHRKCFGCLVYPLVLFTLLAVPRLRAQTSPDPAATTPAAPQATEPQAPEQQPPEQPAQQPEDPQANQIRLAREAQARIRARRRQRVQRAIEDTYSHKYEIYGGGGYLRFRPGPPLQHLNETAWNGGFTKYIGPRLGITADLRGYYGTAYTYNNQYNIHSPAISEYTFMAGPQYRILRGEKWAVTARVLGGAAKGNFNGNSADFPGTLVGLWPSGTTYAIDAGALFDYNLGPGLAARIATTDLITGFGSTVQSKGLGFTAGIVYRFGRQ